MQKSTLGIVSRLRSKEVISKEGNAQSVAVLPDNVPFEGPHDYE